MTPQELIDDINTQVSTPTARFRCPMHFYRTMRKHYNPSWTWPKPDAPASEWAWLYGYGVEYAKQKEVMQQQIEE